MLPDFSVHINGALDRLSKRNLKLGSHVLDPAAEEFNYPVTLDIKELITVEDVMEELNLGPNG